MAIFTAFYGNKVMDEATKKAVGTKDGLGTAVEIDLGDNAFTTLCNAYSVKQAEAWLMNGFRDKLMGISNTIGDKATTNAKGAVDLKAELEGKFQGVYTMTTDAKKVETKKDDTATIALLKIIASAVNSKAMELASLDKDVQEAVKPYLTVTA